MSEPSVSAVMDETVREIAVGASASTAARRLSESDVPALVVRGSAGSIAGIVTEADIVAVLAEHTGDPPVGEVMTRPVVTTEPAEPLGAAITLLREADVTVVSVVEDGTPVGLLTSEAVDARSRDRLASSDENAPLAASNCCWPSATASSRR